MMMMIMLALVAAVLARRGGAPGARVAAAAVDVAVVAVAATRVADAAGARRERIADAAALRAVAAGRADAPPPGASAGVRPRPAAGPRARVWSILTTVACGAGVGGVDESANESVEGSRGKGAIDEAGVRRGRDRVLARRGAGTTRASATKSIVARRGGFATREKKGRRTKKSPGGGRVRDPPFILLALERAPWSVLPPPDALPAPVGAFFSTVVHPSSTIVADRSTCATEPLLCEIYFWVTAPSRRLSRLSAMLVTSRDARN